MQENSWHFSLFKERKYYKALLFRSYSNSKQFELDIVFLVESISDFQFRVGLGVEMPIWISDLYSSFYITPEAR